MIDIHYIIDDKDALAALARAPATMDRQLEQALDRSADEVQAEMMRAAGESDVTGVLKSSIEVRQLGPLSRFVTPTADYADYVEEGTGPAAGRARYFPNPDNLRDFIEQSPAVRGFGWARPGSRKRGTQELEVWFRSRALARAIYMKGTQPHPFVAPTAEKMTGRFFALMDEGAARGVAEILNG